MSRLDSTFDAVIANGGTVSDVLDMVGHTLCGIFIPAAFTGVALTFQASPTATGTFVSVRDGAGAALTVTVAAGQYIPIDPKNFHGLRYLKIVSGSAEGAARTLTVAGKLF